MKKRNSKRFKKILELSTDSKKNKYKIDDCVKSVKNNCTTKFDESIDVSFRINTKQKKEEVNIRTTVNLPNGNGKKIRVAVLCEEGKLAEAKDSGADIFGSDNLVNDITAEKINFDKLVATPAMMPKMSKLGKILGPKGLMPNPKLGTVTNNVSSIVKALKNGQIEIKNDKDGNIAASIGKKSFPDTKVVENFKSILETLLKEKPDGIKGDFIISAFLTSTMGVSYKLNLDNK
jgi:large subunit ribosomal protein L1